MKPLRRSVAAIIRRPHDRRFLAVRRPYDDDHLPGVWGLPAVTLGPDELAENAAERIGREKLGVAIRPLGVLGSKVADRGTYRLILTDVEALLPVGDANVWRASSAATRYIDQIWTSKLDLLVEAAERGSLCCQIFLDVASYSYRKNS